jgi:hypothetical protein
MWTVAVDRHAVPARCLWRCTWFNPSTRAWSGVLLNTVGATLGKPGTPVTFTPSVDVAALPVMTLVGSGEVAATLPVSRTGIAGQYQFLMPFGPLIRGSGTLTVRVNAGSVNCGSTALQIIGLGDTDTYQGPRPPGRASTSPIPRATGVKSPSEIYPLPWSSFS